MAPFVSLPAEEFLKFSLISSPPSGCSLSWATECGQAPLGDSETRGGGKLVPRWGLDLTFPKTKSRLSRECVAVLALVLTSLLSLNLTHVDKTLAKQDWVGSCVVPAFPFLLCEHQHFLSVAYTINFSQNLKILYKGKSFPPLPPVPYQQFKVWF